ncbi:MAG TPA: 4Fe-4S binding protein [Oligoflexia bacterium]|nr:4Fe-4S binding protein [Oligoflexia bacterium]
MPFLIDKNCTRCGACLPECPTGAIAEAEPIFLIDADVCSDCMACVPVCPVHAIQRIPEAPKTEPVK